LREIVQTGSAETDVVRAEVGVPCSPAEAFALFALRMGSWWPREFTWSQDSLELFGLEPRAGGACFEVGPYGFRCDWGRVLTWSPPQALTLCWQVGPDRAPEPDPSKASEVHVRIEPRDHRGSHVSVEHAGFERHGPGGNDYRAGMQKGWAYLLERYAAHARADGC
jgi:uncharacterized protein YndB with AHSA1/START domain